MVLTSTDVANQALVLMGDNQPLVTGAYPNFNTTNSSEAGKALNLLYGTTVDSVSRQFPWDFARKQSALSLTGNTAPVYWLYEYLYPDNAVQLWQILPSAIVDRNNPIPINWSVGNTLVSGLQKKVIWTNIGSALCVFNNRPLESVWDSLFTQSVVRLLASAVSTALAGRPDIAQLMIKTGSLFESVAEMRDS